MKTTDACLAEARTSDNQQDMTAVRPTRSVDELREAARKRADEVPVHAPSLTVAGPSLIMSWHDIPWPNAGNWVGMYRRGSEEWDLVTWSYTDGLADGSGYLTVPATAVPGPHELRLFYDESMLRLATGGPFRVVDYDYVAPLGGSWLPGQDIHPQWAASYPLADYVALAKFAAPDKSTLAYSYLDPVPEGDGSLVIPAGTEVGEYEIRLFTNPWTRRATAHLTVDHPTARLSHDQHSTDAVALLPGSHVTVSWSGIPAPTGTDWVGLFPHGATHHEYVAWIYTNGASSGSGTLTVPATVKPGRHELRLFAANGYHPIGITYHADDIRIGTGPRLGNYPDYYFPACHTGKAVCTWQYVYPATATDWIGLYHSGAGNHDYLAWKYTDGTSFGSLHLPLPAGLPHGDYEVRMFRNNGYTQVAFDLLFL